MDRVCGFKDETKKLPDEQYFRGVSKRERKGGGVYISKRRLKTS